MSDENTFAQFLLLDELLNVIGHRAIIMLWGMKRLSMVSQILTIRLDFQLFKEIHPGHKIDGERSLNAPSRRFGVSNRGPGL